MEQFTDFWCFRLGAIVRRIGREYNSRYQEHGITLGQSFILFDLLEYEGKSVKEIAGNIQVDSPAVTGFIDRMSREGLVERREAPEDRRSFQIFLTDKGRLLAEKVLPIAEEYNRKVKTS